MRDLMVSSCNNACIDLEVSCST